MADKVTAQVAVEAIVNAHGDGYDVSTMHVVLADAEAAGVDHFYVDMLRQVVREVENG